MLKRKILTTLLITAITVPSLLITALAVEPSMVRSIDGIALASGFSSCSTCYINSSQNIKNHPNGTFSCKLDKALNGTYSCKNTNYATTCLEGSTDTEGYKDAYVYERDANGNTKTDYKTASSRFYPSEAWVNPVDSYIPVCVRHEVTASHPNTEESLLHVRNYE